MILNFCLFPRHLLPRNRTNVPTTMPFASSRTKTKNASAATAMPASVAAHRPKAHSALTKPATRVTASAATRLEIARRMTTAAREEFAARAVAAAAARTAVRAVFRRNAGPLCKADRGPQEGGALLG